MVSLKAVVEMPMSDGRSIAVDVFVQADTATEATEGLAAAIKSLEENEVGDDS